ncbi:MAG: hypothetical protein JWM91_1091 [Rhodospirillales bacterium]|nr:hypothetical protein [Rhodospirillales bacterium]
MRRDWKLAASAVSVSVAIASVLAFALPSYWRVEITVMPVTKSGSGLGGLDPGSLSGLFGGLAGVGALLGRPSSNQDEALAVLGSRELFDTYATQQNLLPILFSSKWDSANERWNVSSSNVPTLRRAYKLFNRSLRDVDLDRRSGIVTMSITWKDRALAVKWARDLIALTNSQLRERALAEATVNMRYLATAMSNAQSENRTNALNSALANAYERALQNYMFADSQPEFAFRVIDPPTIPDARERVWPQRPLFIALGFILGVILAIPAIHLREFQRSRAESRVRPSPTFGPNVFER